MNKACNRVSILLATEHIGSKDQTIGGGRVGVNKTLPVTTTEKKWCTCGLCCTCLVVWKAWANFKAREEHIARCLACRSNEWRIGITMFFERMMSGIYIISFRWNCCTLIDSKCSSCAARCGVRRLATSPQFSKKSCRHQSCEGEVCSAEAAM